MRTLPFGSVASVLHFNRVARLIWRLGLELGVWWGNYFDDFPCLSHELNQVSTMGSVKALFELLGFALAVTKLAPFEHEAELLGISLSCPSPSIIQVDNKESRKSELASTLRSFLEEGTIDAKVLPSVIGRLQFADMQVSGRQGKLALADIRQMLRDGPKQIELSQEVKDAFSALLKRVTCGVPRTLTVSAKRKPFLLFTDGALEPIPGSTTPLATIGGVLIDPVGQAEVFGSHVNPEVLKVWLEDGPHPIGLVEMYAIAVAYKLWFSRLRGERVIIFCDNWPALDCFVRGSSPVRLWRQLLLCFERLETDGSAFIWMARVPSQSNVADPPSRGDFEAIRFLGEFKRVKAFCVFDGAGLKDLAEADRGRDI